MGHRDPSGGDAFLKPAAADRRRAAPVVSPEQVRERSALCAKASGERVRRDWNTIHRASSATFVEPDTVKMERLLPGPVERAWSRCAFSPTPGSGATPKRM